MGRVCNAFQRFTQDHDTTNRVATTRSRHRVIRSSTPVLSSAALACHHLNRQAITSFAQRIEREPRNDEGRLRRVAHTGANHPLASASNGWTSTDPRPRRTSGVAQDPVGSDSVRSLTQAALFEPTEVPDEGLALWSATPFSGARCSRIRCSRVGCCPVGCCLVASTGAECGFSRAAPWRQTR